MWRRKDRYRFSPLDFLPQYRGRHRAGEASTARAPESVIRYRIAAVRNYLQRGDTSWA